MKLPPPPAEEEIGKTIIELYRTLGGASLSSGWQYIDLSGRSWDVLIIWL